MGGDYLEIKSIFGYLLLSLTEHLFNTLPLRHQHSVDHESVGVFVLLEHTSFDELVDELLHGVEGGEEALRRHD